MADLAPFFCQPPSLDVGYLTEPPKRKSHRSSCGLREGSIDHRYLRPDPSVSEHLPDEKSFFCLFAKTSSDNTGSHELHRSACELGKLSTVFKFRTLGNEYLAPVAYLGCMYGPKHAQNLAVLKAALMVYVRLPAACGPFRDTLSYLSHPSPGRIPLSQLHSLIVCLTHDTLVPHQLH